MFTNITQDTNFIALFETSQDFAGSKLYYRSHVNRGTLTEATDRLFITSLPVMCEIRFDDQGMYSDTPLMDMMGNETIIEIRDSNGRVIPKNMYKMEVTGGTDIAVNENVLTYTRLFLAVYATHRTDQISTTYANEGVVSKQRTLIIKDLNGTTLFTKKLYVAVTTTHHNYSDTHSEYPGAGPDPGDLFLCAQLSPSFSPEYYLDSNNYKKGVFYPKESEKQRIVDNTVITINSSYEDRVTQFFDTEYEYTSKGGEANIPPHVIVMIHSTQHSSNRILDYNYSLFGVTLSNIKDRY